MAERGIILVEMQSNYWCTRLEVTPTCSHVLKTFERYLERLNQILAAIFINKQGIIALEKTQSFFWSNCRQNQNMQSNLYKRRSNLPINSILEIWKQLWAKACYSPTSTSCCKWHLWHKSRGPISWWGIVYLISNSNTHMTYRGSVTVVTTKRIYHWNSFPINAP